MTRKTTMNAEIRKYASLGDLILNKAILNLIRNSNSKQFYPNMYSILISNEFIQHFHCGFKHEYTNPGKKGDMVEAWVYFIYENYGKDAVYRYLIRELQKMKFLIEFKLINLPKFKIT